MRCPDCAFENRDGVKFCEECGAALLISSANICPDCGFQNRQGVQFCEECGEVLHAPAINTCPECGFENRDGVRFCEECGTPLEDTPAPKITELQPPVTAVVAPQPPVIVTVETAERKHGWAWVITGGLFIAFAFLFMNLFWPSLSSMLNGLNSANDQPSRAAVVEEGGQASVDAVAASPANNESSAQEKSSQASSQQSSAAEAPVLVDEETNCNRSKYVRETIPDNTVFQPGERFQKTWTVRNEGECTWNTEYTFEHTQGAYLDAAARINMPKVVDPGDEVTLSLDMRAPDEPGTYVGRWEIFSDDGEVLGWYSVVIVVAEEEQAIQKIYTIYYQNNLSEDLDYFGIDEIGSGQGTIVAPGEKLQYMNFDRTNGILPGTYTMRYSWWGENGTRTKQVSITSDGQTIKVSP